MTAAAVIGVEAAAVAAAVLYSISSTFNEQLLCQYSFDQKFQTQLLAIKAVQNTFV